MSISRRDSLTLLAGLVLGGPVLFAAEPMAQTATDPKSPAPGKVDTGPSQIESQDWVWLENKELRVGLKLASGGGIGWISAAGSERNIINHFDQGRLIQQSYYGREDDSLWNKQPWRWNPVQGGDWRGRPARVLEQTTNDDHTSAFVRTEPVHWASGQVLSDTEMQQRVTLDGPLLKVKYRFLYRGDVRHPARHQEIPACFVAPEMSRLVVYQGDAPWTGGPLDRSEPGWPNESRRMTEHWAAYVDADDRGIGFHVPQAEELTCYRFGNGNAKEGACSYLAPLTTFAVEPGLDWEYDLTITLGTVTDIRQRFQALK